MRILGLSAYGRDSAAALVVDGRVVAAAEEERFTRLAHDPGFPARAASACLREGGVTPRELDAVVFHEKPMRKFERVLALHMQAFPRSARSFARTFFVWLGERLWIKNRIGEELGVPQDRVLFASHADALAAAAALSSPFDEPAVLVVDDEPRVVALREPAQLGERGAVPVHAEDALGDDQSARPACRAGSRFRGSGTLERALEGSTVVVGEDLDPRA